MGHSQFAEMIGARGPNTQINAACASTAQAIALAEDWIRAGRCRRVIVISADDVTLRSPDGLDGRRLPGNRRGSHGRSVEDAAMPFDRRRHGMILGMGAAALVVENADAARERGMQPICEVSSTVTANSAFHGTRLTSSTSARSWRTCSCRPRRATASTGANRAQDGLRLPRDLYARARRQRICRDQRAAPGVRRRTPTPIVITNTKGFTGHAMGAGMEEVVAVKALETGCVPPVANFKEVDPELGPLNLSRGGYLSRGVRAASGRGLRLADQHGAAAPRA